MPKEVAITTSEKRTASQHRKGKLTARERIELLVDAGSFEEWEVLVDDEYHSVCIQAMSEGFDITREGGQAILEFETGAQAGG